MNKLDVFSGKFHLIFIINVVKFKVMEINHNPMIVKGFPMEWSGVCFFRSLQAVMINHFGSNICQSSSYFVGTS